VSVRQANLSTVRNKKQYNTVSAGSVSSAGSGGTTSNVTNYNGTGQTWRVHQFTSNSSFSVTQTGTSERNPGSASPQLTDARLLVVGAGFNGATTGYYSRNGTGGNGGRVLSNDTTTITSGAQSVTIGANGGGNSSLGSFSSSTGSSVGTGGSGTNCCYVTGGGGTAGHLSTITGTSTRFGGGGGGGGSAGDNPRVGGGSGGAGGGGNGGTGATFDGQNAGTGGAGTASTGGGGGGAGGTGDRSNPGYNWNTADYPGGTGGSGIVIVSYRVA
jgi:hypothetical protein